MDLKDYDDILEQVLHDLRLCKYRDDVHNKDEYSGKTLGEKLTIALDHYGYAVLEKSSDE